MILRSLRLSAIAAGGSVSWVLMQSQWGSVILVVLLLVVVITCLAIGGWCVRFNLFAASCAWDILTLRGARARPHDGPIRAFAASGSLGTAIRTRGVIDVDGGAICFRWRPWFVLPPRTVPVDAQQATLMRGVIIHSVTRRVSDESTEDLLLLPPRYRAHHDTLAGRMGVPVEDGAIRRGLRAAWQFVTGIFRHQPRRTGVAGTALPRLAVAGVGVHCSGGTEAAAEPRRQSAPPAAPSDAGRAPVHKVNPGFSMQAGMTIASIQQQFTGVFPNLGLVLLPADSADRAKRGERIRPVDANVVLEGVGQSASIGSFDVTGVTTIGNLERHIGQAFGLHAQVCYMHEGKPVATSSSLDGVSLDALNRRAGEQGRGAFRYPGR
jgi:hypothetical protein